MVLRATLPVRCSPRWATTRSTLVMTCPQATSAPIWPPVPTHRRRAAEHQRTRRHGGSSGHDIRMGAPANPAADRRKTPVKERLLVQFEGGLAAKRVVLPTQNRGGRRSCERFRSGLLRRCVRSLRQDARQARQRRPTPRSPNRQWPPPPVRGAVLRQRRRRSLRPQPVLIRLQGWRLGPTLRRPPAWSCRRLRVARQCW